MDEVLKGFSTLGKRTGSSTMTELIAMHRFSESRLPEDERICFDPLAVHFVNPALIRSAAEHPEEAKARAEQIERQLPGLGNSVRARVRYFDDYTERSVQDGIHQLVILGAGYDTRAYRLEPVKERTRVFELDHPDTQRLKIQKIRGIFGTLPDNVTFVPIDFASEDLVEKLDRAGFSRSERTLFILEGLVMYIPPSAVDGLLEDITHISAKGSHLIFDYYPVSLISGSDETDIAKNIRNFGRAAGEPLRFGIPDNGAAEYLARRNFVKIHNVTSAEYRALYFTGKRSGRATCDLVSFVHAETA